jgi:SAM-dependent methyltransferase
LKRTLEPELMLSAEQARAYAEADFSSAHSLYPPLFAAVFPTRRRNALVLDIGCGPCDVTHRFARANPGWRFHALDGSPAMLRLAPPSRRIRRIAGTIPDVTLPATAYDVILSSSVLHHLHSPAVLWQVVRRYGKCGTQVFIVDLRRPASRKTANCIVEKYSAKEPAVLQRDFYNSLLAAFTPAEVRSQLRRAGLRGLRVRSITDRHLIVAGTLDGDERHSCGVGRCHHRRPVK